MKWSENVLISTYKNSRPKKGTSTILYRMDAIKDSEIFNATEVSIFFRISVLGSVIDKLGVQDFRSA